MGDIAINPDDLAHLSRLALAGRPQDIQGYIRRLARRYRLTSPDLSSRLNELLQELPSKTSPLRGEVTSPLPVDLESRLQLLRVEFPPAIEHDAIWEPDVASALTQIISERKHDKELMQAGLQPTRSLIFTGAPGVGKTLAARWIARELNRPLLILDLSAVMSSYLGRTGTNVRHVLDYAKSIDGVLLLDEIDSIAKRRDDATDVGELKRLVTVLLQEIDDWPSTGLLIAATNHPNLLDPAVWRRFEMRVEFPIPSNNYVKRAIEVFLGPHKVPESWGTILSTIFQGLSFSEIEREIMLARRTAIVQSLPFEESLFRTTQLRITSLGRKEKQKVALALTDAGLSQRQVHDMTGVSRDTIRKNRLEND